ncbi:MAG TPA: hypothetical protein VLD85_11290 [Anaeromyxobacteraceae bacterium]|nr:hypothetical protein [Anaeromyxobacteraceae bacterium]
MSPWVANFLFEAVNFLVLAAALGWLLFKPVRAAIEAERERRAREEAEGRKQRGEAEALMAKANHASEEALREIERQRADLASAAEKQSVQIREQARELREAERRSMEREMEASRLAQASALSGAVGRMAAESIRRLLKQLDGPSLDLALVRGACTELRALPAAARSSAVVEVARPLAPEGRRLLAEVLGGEFRERNAEELGAGVRVTTAAGQVDATALALAREAARALSESAGAAGNDVDG